VSASDSPFDPGLQPERTLLAWRRTCLALTVASAVVVRFAGESMGASAALLGVAGVATAAAAYIRAARRYRRAHEGLTHNSELPIDGLALALMTLTLLLICAGAVVYVAGVGVGRLAAGFDAVERS
jgi:uncharacterized membrane protein YidH (DUF202 family)